jgi:hypothetical protein
MSYEVPWNEGECKPCMAFMISRTNQIMITCSVPYNVSPPSPDAGQNLG